ncbi:MAG: hypothetical protein ACJA0Q_001043 [Saprospiraceae bacterium]|jgi:hypothetical protein
MLLAASIPLSKFSTSVCMFSIVGAWLFSDWRGRLQLIKVHGWSILIGTGLFLVFVGGLWNTEDTAYAFRDLRVKLPLLVIPLVLFTGPKFSKNHVLSVFGFLSAGAVFSSVIGYINYLSISSDTAENFRAMSPFISHIRLSLTLCFSLAFFYYLLLTVHSVRKWLLVGPSLFILFYLSELQSLTALVILPVILIATLLFYPPWKQSKKLGRIIGVGFSLIILLLVYKVNEVYQEEFQTKEIPNDLPKYTVNGALYLHDLNNPLTENGNYVGLYYCEKELSQEWEKVSTYSIDSLVGGYPLWACLTRYLTSKDYTKDSLGVSQLTSIDIVAVESGIANHKFLDGKGIATRIHTSFWEVKNWTEGSSGHESSIAMRFFLWDTAKKIIKQNLWTGVGLGDVENALKKEYSKSIVVDTHKIKRTHNQYLSVAVALGFVGVMAFVFLFMYPFVLYDGTFKHLYTVIGLIFFMSMLWEDTIETQAGVALFGLLIHVPFVQYLREKESSKTT